jgi:hypothetical protein
MINDINQKARKALCGRLIELGEDIYARLDKLKTLGWDSFEPLLKLKKTICDSEEFKEYKKVQIELSKENIGRDAYDASFLMKLREKADNAITSSGNAWDDALTDCEKKILKMRIGNSSEYDNLFSKYRIEQQRLRDIEIEKHSKLNFDSIDEKIKNNNLKLYKEIMDLESNKLGFSYDKDMSSRKYPVFTKSFFKPWKLGFKVDSVGLLKERKGKSNLIMNFGLVHENSNGGEAPKGVRELIYSELCFYPVENTYRTFSFANYEELEVLIYAQLAMYSLIQDKFEKLLLEGFNELTNS